MNESTKDRMLTPTRTARAVSGILLSALMLGACATAPVSPPGAAEVRGRLSALQGDPQLASHARVEIRTAEEAVRIAEQPVTTAEAPLGAHRVYLADRQVEIARAKAATRNAEADRVRLGEERDRARLQARTLEADRARADADRARLATDAALAAGAESRARGAAQATELQRQIDALEAQSTERGLVLTLGDVLFQTGSAALRAGPDSNLNRLVTFLNEYPERRVLIEGHTDNVGSAAYNRDLSQRRAESVRSYLAQSGIASSRLSASGMGMDRPVADNATSGGRQQNRRVEVIIENPPQASSTAGSL